VFEHLAQLTRRPVICPFLPSGPAPFLRQKDAKYSAHQLVKLINRSLQPQGLELLDRGKNFIVVHIDRLER
jgi:hypothetical protein